MRWKIIYDEVCVSKIPGDVDFMIAAFYLLLKIAHDNAPTKQSYDSPRQRLEFQTDHVVGLGGTVFGKCQRIFGCRLWFCSRCGEFEDIICLLAVILIRCRLGLAIAAARRCR
ncbi:hypothetical protein CA85_13700 [Allorhodopirellula solitaria]|uniref:Uncharacterized protein n=1 Tax=Allorhodopirellula solitaria TaxID=2527987 RepID=A0A5C5YD95_9BACT|nr:hypothetical protein CA85_13700 [Allorhodopirellula solitaria]